MRAGLAAWLWIAAGGLLTAAYGCGPEFVAGAGGSGGDGGTGNTGGGGSGPGGSGGTGGAPCMDADGDGVTECDGDCDDGYALAYTGADEICDGADNDCDGAGDPASCMGMGTFVAPSGVTGNTGTRDQPLPTIAEGIANAVLLDVTTVYIAEGSYGEAVELPPGVSLRGGHEEPTWRQDPEGHPSAVDCDGIGAFVCVRAGATVGRDSIIDGLTIRGASGAPTDPPGSVALSLDSASPTINRCRILGGNVTGMAAGAERSIAVHVLGQPSGLGPLLEGNEIVGGEGPNDASIGVLLEAGTAAEIVDNDITSGPGQSSWGVLDGGAVIGTELVDNRIHAGNSEVGGVSFGIVTRGRTRIARNFVNAPPNDPPTCADTVLWCGGIASYSSAARIENNIVFGALARQSVALHLVELDAQALGDVHVNANYLDAFGNASTDNLAKSAAIALGSPYAGSPSMPFAVIRNNILLGGRNQNQYGVFEDSVPNQTCTPDAFTHNLFFFPSGSGVLYRQWTGTVPGINIGVIENLPAAYINNLSADPMVDAGYHLMAGSPCIDAGTHLDAPDDDFEGDPRPLANPVDIGPDEAQ